MRRDTKNIGGSRLRTWSPAIAGGLIAALLLAACSSSDEDGEATTAPTVNDTATDTATATTATGPAAPTDVLLTGPLPDTNATVTPGEGETGRVTLEWAYPGEAGGFRIYQKDCDGNMTGDPIEVGPGERTYGPLQPCRPGGQVGVAAYDATGESEIVWGEPGEAS